MVKIKLSKILILVIVSVFCIPISGIFSSIIHFRLSNIEFVLDIQTLISSILTNKNHMLMFLIVQAFVEFILLYLFLFSKKNTLSTETDTITKTIKTPKAYGQGQHGTSRWSSKKEMLEKLGVNTIETTKTGEILEYKAKKGGLVVGMEKHLKKDKIFYIPEDYHSVTIGSTGAGKTRRLVLPSVVNYALAGESLILTDPKRGNFAIHLSPTTKTRI